MNGAMKKLALQGQAGGWQQLRTMPCLGRRLAAVVLGNLLMGLAVTLLRMSRFGNDPFSCMNLGYSLFTQNSFGFCMILCNGVLVLFVLRLARSYIHVGTLVNMFLIGILSDAFYVQLTALWGSPESYLLCFRSVLLVIGVLLSCYGCSAYSCAELGLGPYDAIGWIVERRSQGRLSFRYFRIAMDTVASGIGFILGSIVGPGTIIMALCTGPLIAFFNEKINRPLLYGGQETAEPVRVTR